MLIMLYLIHDITKLQASSITTDNFFFFFLVKSTIEFVELTISFIFFLKKFYH
jgi:hypothetical protein